jgi:hypothetical protein
MSDVFLVDARAASVRENYIDKIRLLFRAPGFAEMIPKSPGVTFVKANYSPIGYTRHIRPVLVSAVVESIRNHGGNPAVTDTSGFFPRGKYVGEEWFSGAEMMGYSELALGCERVLANGYEGDDGEFISTGGADLGGVEVARAVREAACLVVASHFTAHPMAGLSGAIVNVGLECLNNSGKARVYEDLKPDFSKENCISCGTCVDYCQWGALSYEEGVLSYDESLCAGCGHCLVTCPHKVRSFAPEQIEAFQRRVAEASAAVAKTLGKPIIYINYLIDIVPQSYRYYWADVPFVPDLGFAASTDPVALDAFCQDLVAQAPGVPRSVADDAGALKCGVEKFKAITGVDPAVMLAHAESLGVGSRDYEVLIAGR